MHPATLVQSLGILEPLYNIAKNKQSRIQWKVLWGPIHIIQGVSELKAKDLVINYLYPDTVKYL